MNVEEIVKTDMVTPGREGMVLYLKDYLDKRKVWTGKEVDKDEASQISGKLLSFPKTEAIEQTNSLGQSNEKSKVLTFATKTGQELTVKPLVENTNIIQFPAKNNEEDKPLQMNGQTI